MNTKMSWLCICLSVCMAQAAQEKYTRKSIQDQFVRAAAYDDEILLKAFLEDQELKDLGFDVDVKDGITGWTALHAALRCGNYRASKFLLDNGATFENTALPGETKYTRLLKSRKKGLLGIKPPREIDESIPMDELLEDWKTVVRGGNIPFMQAALRLGYVNPWSLTNTSMDEIKKSCEKAFDNNAQLLGYLEKQKKVEDCPVCLEGFSVVEVEGQKFCKNIHKPENWKYTAALNCGDIIHTACFDWLIARPFDEEGRRAALACPKCRQPLDFLQGFGADDECIPEDIDELRDILEDEIPDWEQSPLHLEELPLPVVLLEHNIQVFRGEESSSDEDLDVALEEGESASSDWEESTDV